MKYRKTHRSGFALIVTLSLMILLTVIGVGLLTLSTIASRSTSSQQPSEVARANARLALMLALGQLQDHAGDDQRITADGALVAEAVADTNSAQVNAVGVWKSWSPEMLSNPEKMGVDYESPKEDNFISWLVSASESDDVTSKDWVKSGGLSDPVNLFNQTRDGFSLSGSKLQVSGNGNTSGACAWAVTQAATKAKINVGGPEYSSLTSINDGLEAQPRPSLTQSGVFGEIKKGFNQRAGRVISMSQAELDEELWLGDDSIQGGRDFTTQGFGLITDVVHGGLKTDLNLGFELSDADFSKDTWNGTPNPFRAASISSRFSTPAIYDGERPLFKPITATGSVWVKLNYGTGSNSIHVKSSFPNAAVPTFASLRSFYRTPYHLYNTSDGPTVFQRSADHVAFVEPHPRANEYYPPGATPPGKNSQVGFSPILDRVIFVVGVGLSSNDELRLTFTPIITLWNPYNVALEFEGAVAYPWIDLPFDMNWTVRNQGSFRNLINVPQPLQLSKLMGRQRLSLEDGRSVDPYFYVSITSDGNGTVGKPIRLEPGEVRIFDPSQGGNTQYINSETDRNRTVMMAPVSASNPLSITAGGLSVPLLRSDGLYGFSHKLLPNENVSVTFAPESGRKSFFISLEDASRTRLPSNYISSTQNNAPIGQLMGDVHALYLPSGPMISPTLSYNQLKNTSIPFGTIETYHRVALNKSGTQTSDLAFTANPRQPHVSGYLNRGGFQSGPNYQSETRGNVSGLSDVITTSNGGRDAYYGPANSTEGRTHLCFFEVPREPMLSLAAFQHADLSFSAASPANQTGNSWASAYIPRKQVALKDSQGAVNDYSRDWLPNYDTAFLTNEALWDSFFFSSAAPTIQPGTSGGSPDVWNREIGRVTRTLRETLKEFIADPMSSPLRNTRMRFHSGGSDNATLAEKLLDPEGCTRIGAHLTVDGAFNINSTSIPAWAAVLSGLRGVDFDVSDGSKPAADQSALPRMRHPRGEPDDPWQGYRALGEAEVTELATNIVKEIKLRGPFLSLGEFINRRPVAEGSGPKGEIGLSGPLQAAIEQSNLNNGIKADKLDPRNYPASSQDNVFPESTAVAIPGYLTQADLLQSIAPVITTRSDTFTIRGYGEARDRNGKVLSSACCEAVVQRIPEFVDDCQPAYTATADLNPVNQKFGRKFEIVSFRYLTAAEIPL